MQQREPLAWRTKIAISLLTIGIIYNCAIFGFGSAIKQWRDGKLYSLIIQNNDDDIKYLSLQQYIPKFSLVGYVSDIYIKNQFQEFLELCSVQYSLAPNILLRDSMDNEFLIVNFSDNNVTNQSIINNIIHNNNYSMIYHKENLMLFQKRKDK